MRIVLLVVILAACGNNATGQSFTDGVRTLCDLPNHVPPPDQPYDQRLAGVAEWAEKSVTNAEAKQIGRTSKDDLAKAVAKAGIDHCLFLENGMELQSFADAMKAVCDATKQGPAYVKSHLLNREVVRMLGAMGDLPPAERRPRLNEAVARAGLKDCPMFDAQPVGAELHVAKVGDAPGLVELDETTHVLAITAGGIAIEGKAIVAVRNGDVEPAEKEGGALGINIPRVGRFAAALAAELTKHGKPLAGMTLVVDPGTPFRLLVEAMFSVKAAGFARFAIAVHAGAATKAIPIEMPDSKQAKAATGLRMVVSVTKDKIVVWSISGTEGTLRRPAQALALDHTADLAAALAAIAAKHQDDHTIVIMCDRALPMQNLAEVLVAALSAFPTLWLSTGFE
jgi:biopolymer transport protein ExbD